MGPIQPDGDHDGDGSLPKGIDETGNPQDAAEGEETEEGMEVAGPELERRLEEESMSLLPVGQLPGVLDGQIGVGRIDVTAEDVIA
jgi:hypothetical protein